MTENSSKTEQPKRQEDRLHLFSRVSFKKRKERAVGAISGAFSKRLISFAKMSVPLAAVGLVAILITLSNSQETISNISPDTSLLKEKNIQNELTEAKFESLDNQNRPYKIKAKRAVQTPNNPELVNLEYPSAEIQFDKQNTLAVEAKKGEYTQDEQQLRLEGDVVLEQGEGHIFRANDLHIDLKGNTLHSEQKVSASGPDGYLEAEGVWASKDNNHLVFKGPAKLVVQKQDKKFFVP